MAGPRPEAGGLSWLSPRGTHTLGDRSSSENQPPDPCQEKDQDSKTREIVYCAVFYPRATKNINIESLENSRDSSAQTGQCLSFHS